jgi:hypothetical protein
MFCRPAFRWGVLKKTTKTAGGRGGGCSDLIHIHLFTYMRARTHALGMVRTGTLIPTPSCDSSRFFITPHRNKDHDKLTPVL